MTIVAFWSPLITILLEFSHTKKVEFGHPNMAATIVIYYSSRAPTSHLSLENNYFTITLHGEHPFHPASTTKLKH
ncbi:hypothetical protein K439DRAFT_1141924 [Ramaria rubella]|nr:hypothetical protein K439DRAFT_1141924 [Ramaria rubella]